MLDPIRARFASSFCKERDHGSSNGEYHSRGYVHEVDLFLLEGGSLLTETTGYVVVDEVAFLIKRLIRLCYDVVILFVSCHVDNIVGNTRVSRIALVYDTVRSLNEAVLVYLRA